MQEPQEPQQWQRRWAKVLKTTSLNHKSQATPFQVSVFTATSEVARYLILKSLEGKVLGWR